MADWRKLEQACLRLESSDSYKLKAQHRLEFATLYRAACADLALADSYQLPIATVRYLHQLVGRAHNQLYRTGRFEVSQWSDELFRKVPRRLFHDQYLRVAFAIFWGGFLLAMFLSSKWTPVHNFKEIVMTPDQMAALEASFSQEIGGQGRASGGEAMMMGFYINHNTTIGLRCFAMGLLLGIGGLFETIFNSIYLGAAFGHMTTVPQADNFFQFVTAHGPFELTAIVLSAAAGMRLGFSIVFTRGYRRVDSLIRAAIESIPIMMLAVVMFFLAAIIEGFLSPSPAPYAFKAAVAMISSMSIMFYIVVLGYSSEPLEDEQ
ncbi:hypothetical protein Pan181_52380 [Aeoliella mucimassa]|uniref:Stage II sporulation protein M n=2 Tax=Aeoliella mucimassa TaxID=2527972 RepID=A0A518AW88_9BACT|nr:hypothetical protein Pan181_52380 [Aeoliella mucimassa]